MRERKVRGRRVQKGGAGIEKGAWSGVGRGRDGEEGGRERGKEVKGGWDGKGGGQI